MIRYFVSHHFTTPDGRDGWGNFVLERSVPIESNEDIRSIERLSRSTLTDPDSKQHIETTGCTLVSIVKLPL